RGRPAMSKRPFRKTVAGAVSLALAAPMAPLPALAQQADRVEKPSDGAVSAAACAPFGFTLRRDRDTSVRQRFAGGTPAYAPPMPPPPPPPPVNLPATANAVVVTGSRILAPAPGIIAPPRGVDTERYPDATPNPVHRVADAPVSTFSIDVDTASYANVRR